MSELASVTHRFLVFRLTRDDFYLNIIGVVTLFVVVVVIGAAVRATAAKTFQTNTTLTKRTTAKTHLQAQIK